MGSKPHRFLHYNIPTSGDLQIATLEHFVNRIKGVREHVQSAHDNVTDILTDLSEQLADMSGTYFSEISRVHF